MIAGRGFIQAEAIQEETGRRLMFGGEEPIDVSEVMTVQALLVLDSSMRM